MFVKGHHAHRTFARERSGTGPRSWRARPRQQAVQCRRAHAPSGQGPRRFFGRRLSATGLVAYILWIEGGVVLVGLTGILGYAVYSRRRTRVREARLVPARALLARHLEDRTLSAPDVAALRNLSAPDVIRLFFVVAPSVGLVERAWLREVAVTLGLVDNARARTEAEEWWNRLSGARFLTLVGAEPVVMERLSRDAHPAVRAASAMFLAQYPTTTAVQTLILMLDDTSAVARFAAKDALIRLGVTATSAIAKRLDNADERHAAWAQPRIC